MEVPRVRAPHAVTSTASSAAEHPAPFRDPYDFSVVLGGPLFQLARRAHLCGDALELLHRRIIVITLFAWLPLLILYEGSIWSVKLVERKAQAQATAGGAAEAKTEPNPAE